MNALLLFFALPVATIILAIVLQKILKCPWLVAATFFAIYLIVTYAAFNSSFLIFAIVYTILAYIVALLTRIICNLINCSRELMDNNGSFRITQRPITVSTNCLNSANNIVNGNATVASNTGQGRNGSCNCCSRR